MRIMKIKWRERKIPLKRRPLYRIVCCYLLSMSYEKKMRKNEKKMKNKTKIKK